VENHNQSKLENQNRQNREKSIKIAKNESKLWKINPNHGK
jgi:hypothetical protein